MQDTGTVLDAYKQRQRALSRWDNEGGAKPSSGHAVRADTQT